MTVARPQRKVCAAQNRAFGTTTPVLAQRHGSALTSIVTLAILALLVAASPAAAIVITGGPTYSPGSGWGCTAPPAGSEKLVTTNYTCTGTAGAFTNLYIGINQATTFPFGDKMDSTAGAEPSGNERFVWSADGATFIRYTGQTSIVGYGLVDTRVTLTFSGAGAVVSDATTQALTGTNIRGSVHSLWRIGSTAGGLTINVLIEASDAGSGAWQPADVYFGTGSGHRLGDGSAEVDRSHVDLAFYTSTCGDSQVDGTEQCDTGGSNGSATSCCTTTCQFRASGQTCRTSAGVCDPAETCTGSSGTCPANAFAPSTTVCRPSTGICDPAETCNGAMAACPADAMSPSTTVCRPSAGACDVAENCTGSSATCPADSFQSSTTVCRPSAGVCDVAENCTGSSAACPADSFQSSTTVCRPSAGVCDTQETCTGSSAACPADTLASSATVCRPSAGGCDPEETCTGSGAACPADTLASSGTVCRPSAGICDVAENCDGASAACPADAFVPSTVECRPDAGQCDVAENCTGTQADCPADAFEPDGTSCDDQIACTIHDACSNGQCIGNSMTCGDGIVQGSCGEECDDGNATSNDGCSSTCQIEIGLACPETPLSGCKVPFVPGKSSLKISNKPAPDTKDTLKWKWIKGTRTTLGDYDDPVNSTNYQLCLYDQTGLRIEVTDPAGGVCAGKPCWKAGSTNFKYVDKELTPDGGQKLILKEGPDGKAKILFGGLGANLHVPDLTTLMQPIVVQLQNSDGTCWQATFSGPPTLQTSDVFKDKAD